MRPGRTAAAKAADHKKAHSVGGQILWELVKYVVPALLALIFKFVSDTKSDVEDLKRTVVQIAWQQEQIKDIRASNTEPIVRIIAEAPTASAAASLCEESTRILAG